MYILKILNPTDKMYGTTIQITVFLLLDFRNVKVKDIYKAHIFTLHF